jgi:hypothetical protein
LVELNPVLPAPEPAGLPNFGMTPTGGAVLRAGLVAPGRGTSWPLSSKVGRSPPGSTGSLVCAQPDMLQTAASRAPTGTAKRNAK